MYFATPIGRLPLENAVQSILWARSLVETIYLAWSGDLFAVGEDCEAVEVPVPIVIRGLIEL